MQDIDVSRNACNPGGKPRPACCIVLRVSLPLVDLELNVHFFSDPVFESCVSRSSHDVCSKMISYTDFPRLIFKFRYLCLMHYFGLVRV